MIRFIHNHAVEVVMYKSLICNNLQYLIAQRVSFIIFKYFLINTRNLMVQAIWN
jgi:hypothetical protein